MLPRATVIWLLLLVLAILNGAVREALISPLTGPQVGHVVSTLLLCALVAVTAWLTTRWIASGTRGRALMVGVWWTLLTVAFEFLAGHYLFKDSWQDLLNAYNVARGRIWILVPIVTLLAPVWAHRSPRHDVHR